MPAVSSSKNNDNYVNHLDEGTQSGKVNTVIMCRNTTRDILSIFSLFRDLQVILLCAVVTLALKKGELSKPRMNYGPLFHVSNFSGSTICF